MSIFASFEKLSLNTIEILFVISYVVLASLMLGMTIFSPNVYKIIQITLRFIISFYIIYKFNPFYKDRSISDIERRVVFSCGIYLLLAIIPYDYISQLYI